MNVQATIDSTSVLVGDRVRLTVEVLGAPAEAVRPPEPGSQWGDFLVRAVTPQATNDGGRYEVLMIATRAGESGIPPVEFRAKTTAGSDTSLSTPAFSVLVRSNLAPEEAVTDSAAATAALAADHLPIPATRDWMPLGIALAVALVSAVLGAFLWRKLRRKFQRVPTAPLPPPVPKVPLRPAWEIAIEELDNIVQEDFVGRGLFQTQYVTVTETLRRYLENRYGVPALESTTDELGSRLNELSLAPLVRTRLLALLTEADLVKFAKATPEAQQARELERRVREIVLETRPSADVAARVDPPVSLPSVEASR